IRGRNFGRERGEARVEFDRRVPTASSYVSWSDELVEVRVPLYADSSLVRVVTEKGASNSRLFMSRALLPVRPETGGATAIVPLVNALSVESGAVGSLLAIRGLNFGANRDSSEVLFSWAGTAAFITPDDAAGRGFVSPSEAAGEYVQWSDKEIRVRIPDGAVTGGVAVRTPRGQSEMLYFQVEGSPGSKSHIGRRTYALSTFVTISRVQAGGPNSLYLWMPFPADSASQRGIKSLDRSMEALFPNHLGLSAYYLSNLQNDKLTTVGHDYLVQVYGVETEIVADRVQQPPTPLPSLYDTFTAADALVPAGHPEIQGFVKETIGRERNPYKVASLLFDALKSRVNVDAGTQPAQVVEALAIGKGDAWSIAILYSAMLRAAGVPAAPVAGVVVDDSRKAWNHVWVEFYLYGLGWVPVDPVLAMGADIGQFRPPFEDRSRYFGNMDDRHIAFSRGLARVDPMSPEGRTVSADRRYSFQTIFEEAVGDISGYTSFWSDVEVTGIY
ncbi:MAG: transglutaminase domain-containing protein, partial [Spirochaetia bacterium]|nr:transglutaminase domain-containing protein [Spirochaetia bacterium]